MDFLDQMCYVCGGWMPYKTWEEVAKNTYQLNMCVPCRNRFLINILKDYSLYSEDDF